MDTWICLHEMACSRVFGILHGYCRHNMQDMQVVSGSIMRNPDPKDPKDPKDPTLPTLLTLRMNWFMASNGSRVLPKA